MNLLLAGGSTGGHLSPGVAIAVAWRARGGAALFLTSGRSVEDEVFGGEPFRRSSLGFESGGRAARTARLPFALARAMRAVSSFRPDVALGLGGAASVPGALAARAFGARVALLEVNALPGRATRWLRPFAQVLLAGGEDSARALGPRARAVGVPVRSFEPKISGASARERFGLSPDAPTLLVAGGSQGAEALNGFAAEHAPLFATEGIQVLHLAGPGKTLFPERAYRDAGVRARVFGFLREMGAAYAAADLVLCRGGAATLAEIALAGKPAVIVPYPHHADRHQFANASRLGAGARLIEEGDLDRRAIEGIVSLLRDPKSLEQMGRASRAFARPDAAEAVVSALLSVLPPASSSAPPGAMENRP